MDLKLNLLKYNLDDLNCLFEGEEIKFSKIVHNKLKNSLELINDLMKLNELSKNEIKIINEDKREIKGENKNKNKNKNKNMVDKTETDNESKENLDDHKIKDSENNKVKWPIKKSEDEIFTSKLTSIELKVNNLENDFLNYIKREKKSKILKFEFNDQQIYWFLKEDYRNDKNYKIMLYPFKDTDKIFQMIYYNTEESLIGISEHDDIYWYKVDYTMKYFKYYDTHDKPKYIGCSYMDIESYIKKDKNSYKS